MARRRALKYFAIGAVLLTAVVTASAVYLSYANRQSAIGAAVTWARLAPLPPSAQDVQVDAKGSMFSREFIITFNAPSAAIQQWLAASSGPSSATQSTVGSITTYAIKPGGGAQFAEVKVDSTANHVTVHTYGS